MSREPLPVVPLLRITLSPSPPPNSAAFILHFELCTWCHRILRLRLPPLLLRRSLQRSRLQTRVPSPLSVHRMFFFMIDTPRFAAYAALEIENCKVQILRSNFPTQATQPWIALRAERPRGPITHRDASHKLIYRRGDGANGRRGENTRRSPDAPQCSPLTSNRTR